MEKQTSQQQFSSRFCATYENFFSSFLFIFFLFLKNPINKQTKMNAREIMDVGSVRMFAVTLGAVLNVPATTCQAQNFLRTVVIAKMLANVSSVMEIVHTFVYLR